MWDLVGIPEDRFSHNEAHICSCTCRSESVISLPENKFSHDVTDSDSLTMSMCMLMIQSGLALNYDDSVRIGT